MTTALRTFYPEIEPHRTGTLRVSALHEIAFEESGNPDGKPVVFVHGGPGGGTEPKQRRFFDPAAYRIVLFDQRGCGKSRPHAELRENTTWDLVGDMEQLREHLGIARWQVFGGSWGSTLALAYAEKHPERVSELVLRGIFLLRKQEIDWFYQRGADALFPDAWEEYLTQIPAEERGDLLGAYHRRLTHEDAAVRLAAARAWSMWEGAHQLPPPQPRFVAKTGADAFALAFARIECHYFANGGFFATDTAAPRRGSEHPPHPHGHRPGPLRRGLPDGERLGAAPRLPRGRPAHRARRRALRVRAGQPPRAHPRDRSLSPMKRAAASPRGCPCHSGLGYEACCAPYHRGEREAPDPPALMRSRYAAFARGEAEYLVRTMHEDHPDLAQPRAELLRSLRAARERLRYPSLAILASRHEGTTGEVLFAAGLVEAGRDCSFVELSDFSHDGTGWRYLAGILVPLAALGRAPEGLTIEAFLAIAGAR